LTYTLSRLRSAKDLYQKGGQVTEVMRDQTFRLLYDNRREILELDNTSLYDSKPFITLSSCAQRRFLSKLPFTKPFNSLTLLKKNNGYKNYLELAVRNFIKGYLNSKPLFDLKGNEFISVKELIQFLKSHSPCQNIKMSKQSISNLKNRTMILKPVPKTVETVLFVEYVERHFPHFNKNDFYK